MKTREAAKTGHQAKNRQLSILAFEQDQPGNHRTDASRKQVDWGRIGKIGDSYSRDDKPEKVQRWEL